MSAADLGRAKTTCKDFGLQPILGRRRRRPITGSSQIKAVGKPAFDNRRPERRNRSCGRCAVCEAIGISPNRTDFGSRSVRRGLQGSVWLLLPRQQARQELSE